MNTPANANRHIAEKSQVKLRPGEAIADPRDPLELQLTSIWEMVLGRKSIGMRDNFFDLGGSTLLVRRLLARIKEISGKEIPLSAFFQAQTVEQLANVLRREGWSKHQSWSVMLQAGGSKPALFMIYPGYHVSDLVRHLGSDQPVYGILQRGLDGKHAFDTHIEDMAAHCIKEILSLQPEGPYFLGGRCIGGLVAFEMAQQLWAQAQKVALLVLFDTPTPLNLEWATSCPDRIDGSATQINVHDGHLLPPGPKEKLLDALWKMAYKARLAIESLLPDTMQNVNHVNHQAYGTYSPRVYPGRITYFWARDSHDRHFAYGRQWGWRQLAGGGLDLHSIPGGRATMMREPYVQVLAEKLRTVLELFQNEL
jgi:thioesterase domain-containing protein